MCAMEKVSSESDLIELVVIRDRLLLPGRLVAHECCLLTNSPRWKSHQPPFHDRICQWLKCIEIDP